MRKWYNKKAVAKIAEESRKNKFEKTSEKGLTNELECGIIKKLITKMSNSILKIKQCKKYNDPWDSDENRKVKKRL